MSEEPGLNPLVITFERCIKRSYVRDSHKIIGKYSEDSGQWNTSLAGIMKPLKL